VSDEAKYMQLVRAICKVKNLCKELDLPELVDPNASKVILDASRQRLHGQVKNFIQEVGWENRPVPKHKM